jgi:hypothetical protein
LEALSRGLSVSAACRAQRISRYTYYNWIKTDAEFAKAAEDAIEAGTDRLEDIALERAELQSDTLTIFLLKARRREKYGDTSKVQHSGSIAITSDQMRQIADEFDLSVQDVEALYSKVVKTGNPSVMNA